MPGATLAAVSWSEIFVRSARTLQFSRASGRLRCSSRGGLRCDERRTRQRRRCRGTRPLSSGTPVTRSQFRPFSPQTCALTDAIFSLQSAPETYGGEFLMPSATLTSSDNATGDRDKFTQEVAHNIEKLGASRELQDAGMEFLCQSSKLKYSYNFSGWACRSFSFPRTLSPCRSCYGK